MISYLFSKTKKYFNIKKAFTEASFVLQNGLYCSKGNHFTLVKSICRFSQLKFRVKSNKKNDLLIKEGTYFITPYKYIFMDKKIVFSFVRGQERFSIIKKNVESYLNKLPYKTMNVSFNTENSLIISNTINGKQYNDEEHLWLFINYYLNAINSNVIEKRIIDMSGVNKNIFFYPQHGDCHDKNIFWNEEIPTLIDLDDVDLYPLFYDLFYYVIATLHEKAFTFFRNDKFKEAINVFIESHNYIFCEDVVDFYLGAYVYFWVNKMVEKMNFHEINFYLKWFEKADLSSYPNISAAMLKYNRNLKLLGIKNANS